MSLVFARRTWPRGLFPSRVTPCRRKTAAGMVFAALIAISPLFPSAAFAQGAHPMPVGVIIVKQETIAVTSELPGRISATRIAEVRPRVNGIIERRTFEQGSDVKEGDVLFELDRASYEIAVEAARATVARAEAVLADAERTEKRYASLNERNVTSKAQYDTATTARLQARASLAEARAQLRAAEVNLGYTEIRAPITGRTGRALITEGALVSAQGEVLTRIQQLDVVYADMQQPVSELLRLRRALAQGSLHQIEPNVAEVELYLDDGSLYPHTGKLLFEEASVERSSGQITLRAQFPNPDDLLLPGMYVRVLVEQARRDNAIVIPAQAVRRDASGKTQVYVVGAKTTVEPHVVELGQTVGNRVTVESGLTADDMVIVDGFQKTGPGAPVAPVCWSDPAIEGAKPSDACTRRVSALAPGQSN